MSQVARRFKSLVATAAAPGAVVATVGDLLTPAGGWLTTLIFGAAALALLVFWWWCTRDARPLRLEQALSSDADLSWWFEGRRIRNKHAAHVLVVFALVCFITGGRSYAHAAQGGVVADYVPAVAQLQSRILDELKVSVREQTRTREAVERIRDTVKLETSRNPRKELQNRGIAWTRENFTQAIENRDADAVSLFVSGGMKPDALGMGFISPIQLDSVGSDNPSMVSAILRNDVFTFFSHYDPNVGRALAGAGADLSPKACMVGDPELMLLDKYVDSAQKLQSYRALCGNDAVRAALQQGRDSLNQALESQPGRQRVCVAKLRQAVRKPPFADSTYFDLGIRFLSDPAMRSDPAAQLAHVLVSDYPGRNPLVSISYANNPTRNPTLVRQDANPGDPAVVSSLVERACRNSIDPYTFGVHSPRLETYDKYLGSL